jgi:hypothetical protein
VLQVDMNGDGYYDGVTDQNIKWADNDGRADVQAWSTQPPEWRPHASPTPARPRDSTPSSVT